MEDIGASNTNGHVSIPKEIELEILARLPVKSLMRFKRVCKLWKSTIENDPSFKELQSAQSNTQPGLSRILLSFSWYNMRYMYSASLEGGWATRHLTLPGCGRTDQTCRCSVSEPLNGLVCYYNEVYVFICNPSMRKVKTLPKCENRIVPACTYYSYLFGDLYSTCSFGFDPATEEYKVLLGCKIFTLRTDSITGEVFSLDTDSWRSITGVVPKLPYPFRSQGLCVNGAIHWMGNTKEHGKEVLVAFDIGCEEFRHIPLPDGISYMSHFIKVRGCLALLDYRNRDFIMWVLKDYENQLWVKESVESPHYCIRIKNPISFGDEYTGEMILTPDMLAYENIMLPNPNPRKNEGMQLMRDRGIPVWIYRQHNKQSMALSINNYAETLSPLATKRLLQFGDLNVYLNI